LYQALPIRPLSGGPSWNISRPHSRTSALGCRPLLLQVTSHGHGVRFNWLSYRGYYLSSNHDKSTSESKRQISLGSACLRISEPLLAIAAVTIRPMSVRRKGPLFLLETFLKQAYSLQVAALFMAVLGFWTPYFYLVEYGLVHGMTPTLASYLFAFINAGSFVGRMLSGSLARHLGQFNVITFACYSSAILLFCWLSVTTSAGLIVLAILFGGTNGTIISLMSTVAHTTDHPSKVRGTSHLLYGAS
jgi:hypothetical protein